MQSFPYSTGVLYADTECNHYNNERRLKEYVYKCLLLLLLRFPNLGIQCCKKRDVAKALKQRLEKRVDPFDSKFYISSNFVLQRKYVLVSTI